MDEYVTQAIDILTCHYTDLGSKNGGYTYSDGQVMWALEIAINFMVEKQED